MSADLAFGAQLAHRQVLDDAFLHVVVAADPRDLTVSDLPRLVDVHVSAFARFGPFDVEQDRDAVWPNDAFRNVGAYAFAEYRTSPVPVDRGTL
jgi:hypothetical protein